MNWVAQDLAFAEKVKLRCIQGSFCRRKRRKTALIMEKQ